VRVKLWSEKLKVRDHSGGWEENIRMNLRETGREDMEWLHLAQNREQWRAVVNKE
jgi:hypothetical protein